MTGVQTCALPIYPREQLAYPSSGSGLTVVERTKRDISHGVVRGASSSTSFLLFHVARRSTTNHDVDSIWNGEDKGFRVVLDIDAVK